MTVSSPSCRARSRGEIYSVGAQLPIDGWMIEVADGAEQQLKRRGAWKTFLDALDHGVLSPPYSTVASA